MGRRRAEGHRAPGYGGRAVADTHPPDSRAGRVLAGRYRLDQVIATGGMAQVWESTDEVLARAVAVKILHPHLAADETFVSRFRQEAVAAARLTHPSIVSVYDTCSDEGTEAIVMELVRGRTLRDELDGRDDRCLDPVETVAIVAQVADALETAHRAGIVHRDVKPANILLSSDGRVLVADFGIAKAVEGRDLTHTGTTLGTAKYLAPEQVEGAAVDARTDVYALGVILYELVCGRPPFTGDAETAIALARLQRDPLRPRQVRAGIPRQLEDIIMKALARSPQDRYSSAGDLRAALLSLNPAAVDDLADAVYAGPDATVPVSTPEPPVGPRSNSSTTPPTGVPRFARTERSWLVPSVLIVLVVLAMVMVGLLVSRSDAGRTLLGRDTDTDGIDDGDDDGDDGVTIADASAFDPPPGDGSENDGDAGLAIDDDPTTAWTTQGYDSRDLGGLKDGVGLVVVLDEPAELERLTVASPSNDWSAEIYLSPSAASDLGAWGEPVASEAGIDAGEVTFELEGRPAGAVLVWITDLGDEPPRAHTLIADISVQG